MGLCLLLSCAVLGLGVIHTRTKKLQFSAFWSSWGEKFHLVGTFLFWVFEFQFRFSELLDLGLCFSSWFCLKVKELCFEVYHKISHAVGFWVFRAHLKGFAFVKLASACSELVFALALSSDSVFGRQLICWSYAF